MKLPERKKIRLNDFDYSQNGCYFITICAKNKSDIFGKITGDNLDDENSDSINIILTNIGNILKESIERIPVIYNGARADVYCIMPDHVHMILEILHEDGGDEKPPEISVIIGCLKRYVSKTAGVSIWQKSFYEHIIRNEKNYEEITDYIYYNPKKWVFQKYYGDNIKFQLKQIN